MVTPTVAKHVAGQAVFQLAVLLSLVAGGEKGVLGVDHETVNTLVFSAFVMMQLFNQVGKDWTG